MQALRADTETKVRMGPFVDKTDGFTPETGVTLAGGGDNADEAELLKAAGAATVDISGDTWAAIAGCDGWYDLTITAGQLDTEGVLTVVIQNDSEHLPVHKEFMVMPQPAFDAFYAAATTDYLQVDMVQIGGSSVAGNAATLTLKQLDIQNNAASAVIMSATGGNGHGLQISGNGTGEGISATGGATGHGMHSKGGSTSGNGIFAEAAIEGDGIYALAKGTDEHGILAVGGDTSGDGINATAANDGDGIEATAAGNNSGINATGSGTEHGLACVAGGTGHGIECSATSGDGIKATGATNGHGMELTGAGTGEGLTCTGGGTGNGISGAGGGGNTAGMTLTGAGTGSGLIATGGATGDGIAGTAGGGNNDGMVLTKAGTGKDLNSDQTTNLEYLLGTDTGVAADGDLTTHAVDGCIMSHVMTAGADTSDYNASTDSLEALSSSTYTNVALDTTLAVRTSDTVFTMNAGHNQDDSYNNGVLALQDVTDGHWEVRKISDYTGATKTIEVDTAFKFVVAANDVIKIFLNAYAPTVAAGGGATAAQVWDYDVSGVTTQGYAGTYQKIAGGRYG